MIHLSLLDLKRQYFFDSSCFSTTEIKEGLERVKQLNATYRPKKEYFTWDISDKGQLYVSET